MITTSEDPGTASRAIRIAIVGSVFVHALVLIAALFMGQQFERLLAHVVPKPVPTPPQTDEIITISSAPKYAQRPTPVTPQRPMQVAQPQDLPRPPSRPVVPQPVAVAQPAAARPALQKHEISRDDPDAPAQPQKTTTAPPRLERQPQQVAYEAPSRPSKPEQAQPSHFSQQQMQQFQRDFQRTIAQTRSDVNPLKVNPDPAAAPKRYRIQMEGLFGRLSHGEGIYYPSRGWRSGGYDYYYCSYQYTYPDGTIETGVVPWPIHFAPSEDPFISADDTMLRHTPLPPPPPGFVPPGDLGKALRGYFPDLHFEDQGAQP
jgi:hypothetical protein